MIQQVVSLPQTRTRVPGREILVCQMSQTRFFFLRFHVCFLLHICIIVFMLLSHPHPNLAQGFCSVRKKIREYKNFMVGRFSLILFEGALLAACSCLCSNSCFGKCFWDCRDFLLVCWFVGKNQKRPVGRVISTISSLFNTSVV